MKLKIETPPALRGEPEQQLSLMSSYLFRLAEMLNVALNSLNENSYTSATELQATNGSKAKELGADSVASYNELRGLINNTSQYVHSEIEKLSTELEQQYVAISKDWGTFQENISNSIEATAEGIVQSYGYDAEIQTLQEAATGFSAYKISTEGYIRQGFIDYDENNIPIVGIAIGQGLTSSTVTINGVEYQQIDNTASCAFYTATKVSFRINGQEVAYVSNRKLYIGDVEITGSVVLGGKWMISTTGGLSIKWIGG